MMRYPGRFAREQIYSNVVSSLDILPTCLDAAGIDMPSETELDGHSLYQNLAQPRAHGNSRGALFWHFQDQFAVREGDWKIVQTKERPGGVRLYNLAQDLAESTDLSEQHPEVFSRLMRLYEEWKSRMGEADGL